MLIIAILAAASAWLVTREAPQHRPLAWALTVCAGLDAVRLLGLPARGDMALCLAAPAVSTWAYGRTFLRPAAWFAAIWVYAAGFSWTWVRWELGLLVAYATELCLIGIALTWNYVPVWTISQRAALILLAGDALAVASLCAREWIADQAGVVLTVVTVYHMTWWWRWNREIRSARNDERS